MISIINNSGNWYKGNLHTHTARSDGRRTPEEVIELYRAQGYDFLALTDHWVRSETTYSGKLLLLSGGEWDTGAVPPIFHIVGVGMDRPVELERALATRPQPIIDAIRQAGGLAILAHPAWSLTDPGNLCTLEGLCGIEVYNTVSGTPWNGRRADSSLYLDLCAARGTLLRSMAADDSHFYDGDETTSFIMVHAPELTAPAILAALRRGDFYASQGPLFQSVTMEGGVVAVRCTEAEHVVFNTNAVYNKNRVVSGGVGEATYRLTPADRYLRIELIDRQGRMAWTSPFPVSI